MGHPVCIWATPRGDFPAGRDKIFHHILMYVARAPAARVMKLAKLSTRLTLNLEVGDQTRSLHFDLSWKISCVRLRMALDMSIYIPGGLVWY